jgi:hypothetical protein
MFVFALILFLFIFRVILIFLFLFVFLFVFGLVFGLVFGFVFGFGFVAVIIINHFGNFRESLLHFIDNLTNQLYLLRHEAVQR